MVAFGLLFAIGPAPGARAFDDHVIGVPDADLKMQAAIAKARSTLDTFLALAEAPPPGAEDFALKVMIRSGGLVEHIWLTPFQRVGGRFAGKIDNEPASVKTVVKGQVYAFGREDISDWGYIKDDKLYGYFTLRVLLAYMRPDERAHYERLLAPE